MKLNLGCGYHKLEDFVNVDRDPQCQPDMEFDLEQPWPLATDSVDIMVMHHTLEHLGETTQQFFSLIQEMYRVSRPNCTWKITVPHFNSDVYHIDPTHVRKIHPTTLRMFDQSWNQQDLDTGGHHTKLGLMLQVDLEVVREQWFLQEPWNSQLRESNLADIDFAGRHYNNVCSDIYIECRVHKPARINHAYTI